MSTSTSPSVLIAGEARSWGVPLHREVVGFAKAADAYERGRPGYPRAVVDWIAEIGVLGPGRVVVDLAAGTGKLTRELVGTGAEMLAVEPLAEMLATLAVAVDGAKSVVGRAEATTLPADSADVVTVAQAFHWFAGEPALAEISRVLRPDGVLALVWNRRDLAQPLQREVSRIIEPYRSDTPSHISGHWRSVMDSTARFSMVAELHAEFEQVVDRVALVDRVGSISFISALADEQRVAVLAEISELVADEPATQSLHYVTDAYAYRPAH
jgi:ubiquinone/menaquinone biosynthesis C-methylase UbiE